MYIISFKKVEGRPYEWMSQMTNDDGARIDDVLSGCRQLHSFYDAFSSSFFLNRLGEASSQNFLLDHYTLISLLFT